MADHLLRFSCASLLAVFLAGCKPESPDLPATQTAFAKTASGAILPIKTQTPTAAAPIADTAAPVETSISTPAKAAVVFGQAVFSSEILYRGAESCIPQTLKVEVQVTPPEMVASVGLFYRITAKSGQHNYPWSEGLAMNPQLGGWYQRTLIGDELPNFDDWWEDAWLDFQFVANDADGLQLARSEVVRSVTIAECRV